MIYLQLFYTFFKIGLFGFGGGYAMISMIQGEVVTKYHWLSNAEFTNIIAISQMTPGPIGINSATYVGYATTGSILGSAIATFAVMFPSFILMLSITKVIMNYKDSIIVTSIFKGLRPAVVALLAAAVLVMMTPANFSTPYGDMYGFIISVLLFLATFIATLKFKVNPILMIIVAGVLGAVLYA